MKDTIQRVVQRVDAEEVLSFVKELVAKNTVESEEPVVPVVAERMRAIGMEVEIHESHNPAAPERKGPCILGTLRGRRARPLLCFNGHTDVVPVEFPEKWSHPPFEPVVEGGRLYGRGTCDMKGGLGAMIMAVQSIVDAGVALNGTLAVAAVPGEETGGWGTASMAGREAWDGVVVGEPTGLSINPACNGITSLWIRVAGRSAHASMPERGINAIDKMVRVMNALEDYRVELSSRVHPLTGTPAFVPCIIEGGWRGVIVADECRLHVTTHLVPGETAESRFTEVRDILERLMGEDPELQVELLDWNAEPVTLPFPADGPRHPRLDPTEVPVEAAVVQAMLRGSRDALDDELPMGGSRYACDTPFFVNEAKAPALVFGPGSIDQAHTYDEWVEIEQLVKATKVYAAGALRFLGHE